MFFEEMNVVKYNEVYDNLYAFLKDESERNPDSAIQELERYLSDLYANEGNDWLGRNEYKTASLNATIAACETLLHELREKNAVTG